jgi:hypothetical protein
MPSADPNAKNTFRATEPLDRKSDNASPRATAISIKKQQPAPGMRRLRKRLEYGGDHQSAPNRPIFPAALFGDAGGVRVRNRGAWHPGVDLPV